MRLFGSELQGFRRNEPAGTLEDFRGPGQKGGEYGQTWAGLTRIPVVYTCINKITSALSRYPRRVLGPDGKKSFKPFWVESPNPYMGGGDLISAIAVSLLLDGNAYLFTGKDRAGRVNTVGVANPRVVDEYVSGGQVVWYVNGRRRVTPFFHLRSLTIPGRMKGLARVVPLKAVADISVESLRYTQVMLRRGMALQYALKGPARFTGTGEGRQSIRQMLRDYHSGFRRAFNPLVLLPGLEVEALPKDAVNANGDFIDLQQATDVQIAAAFGVPPESIGLFPEGSSSTYKNQRDAQNRFYAEAVAPIATIIEEGLSELLPMGSRFDLDQTPSLLGGPHDRALWAAQVALAEKHLGKPILSGKEYREALGFEGPPPRAPKPVQPAGNLPGSANMSKPADKKDDSDGEKK